MRRLLFFLLSGLCLAACKKDTINVDDLTYNFYDSPYPKANAIFITETYRNWNNPQCDFFIKGKIDFSAFEKLPRNYKVQLSIDNKEFEDVFKINSVGDSIKVRYFVVRYHDYVKDSLNLKLRLFIAADELYNDTANYWKFPVKMP